MSDLSPTSLRSSDVPAENAAADLERFTQHLLRFGMMAFLSQSHSHVIHQVHRVRNVAFPIE
jgi:hypothetical protein